MNPWSLPESVEIHGKWYPIHADYRDILTILQQLDDQQEPEFVRWQVALALFYQDYKAIPAAYQYQAMERLAEFINCGQAEQAPRSTPKLLDWEQDALAIAADVNKVAGCEVRELPFLHWWSFMAFFNAIGEGQLSTLVSIRDKLRRGKSLEKWEQQFYRENKARIDLKTKYTAAEQAEMDRLNKLLGQ